WPHDLTKVNAEYSPLENSIVLVAVILQHPFYSFGLPCVSGLFSLSLMNVSGVYFSLPPTAADGNKRDWWSEEARNNFTTRRNCVIGLYKDQIEEETCLKINEKQTLNENIADIKGLESAFEVRMR
ncbi:unnamed protein product, partial [Ixodes pacificus]